MNILKVLCVSYLTYSTLNIYRNIKVMPYILSYDEYVSNNMRSIDNHMLKAVYTYHLPTINYNDLFI